MASESAIGAESQLTSIKESTWGTTPGTPTTIIIPCVSESLKANIGLVEPATIRADRRMFPPIQGNLSPSGDINIEWFANAHGRLIYFLLGGTPGDSGSGPYTHTVEESTDADLPSFTLSKEFTDIAQYLLYTGCRISKATFNV